VRIIILIGSVSNNNFRSL